MFIGTSPAFDLAMFSTCFIRGTAAIFYKGKRETDCDCQIDVGGIKSKVQMLVVEKEAKPKKVCTAYPTNVQCKFSQSHYNNKFCKEFYLKHLQILRTDTKHWVTSIESRSQGPN